MVWYLYELFLYYGDIPNHQSIAWSIWKRRKDNYWDRHHKNNWNIARTRKRRYFSCGALERFNSHVSLPFRKFIVRHLLQHLKNSTDTVFHYHIRNFRLRNKSYTYELHKKLVLYVLKILCSKYNLPYYICLYLLNLLYSTQPQRLFLHYITLYVYHKAFISNRFL